MVNRRGGRERGRWRTQGVTRETKIEMKMGGEATFLAQRRRAEKVRKRERGRKGKMERAGVRESNKSEGGRGRGHLTVRSRSTSREREVDLEEECNDREIGR